MEEGKVGNFLSQVDHVLARLVVEDVSRVDVVHLDCTSFEGYSDDSAIRRKVDSLDVVPLLEVAQVVVH